MFTAAFDDALSTLSPVSTDDALSGAPWSARAVSAAPCQSLAGIVERLIQPMIRTISPTQEIQQLICRSTRPPPLATSGLSLNARCTAEAILNWDDEAPLYHTQGCPDWKTTTHAMRYDATTMLRYEDGLRQELDEFVEWVEERMYLSLDKANDQLGEDEVSKVIGYGRTGSELFVDAVISHDRCVKLYLLFRRRGKARPISYLVMITVKQTCTMVVKEALKSRVLLSAVEKQRIAAKAVEEAQEAAREAAMAKRRRTK